jgi:hypothetical protein
MYVPKSGESQLMKFISKCYLWKGRNHCKMHPAEVECLVAYLTHLGDFLRNEPAIIHPTAKVVQLHRIEQLNWKWVKPRKILSIINQKVTNELEMVH